MIRVLHYLLLLVVCSANDAKEPGKSPSYIVHDGWQKVLATTQNTSTVTYYGPPGVPSFPDTIQLPNKGRSAFLQDVRFGFANLTLYNLSSAYSLKYKIDPNTKTIEIHLGLTNVHIKGISLPTDDRSQNFVVNFYKITIPCYTHFELKNGTVLINKSVSPYSTRPYVYKTNVTSDIYEFIHADLSEKLLGFIKFDICEEIHKKINLDDVRVKVQREIFYMYRAAIGPRFASAVENVFKTEKITSNIFNNEHFDTTNFTTKIEVIDGPRTTTMYDVRIPSFRLRGNEELNLHQINVTRVSFDDDKVYLTGEFNIKPRLMLTIVYRDSERRGTENTIEAEYQILKALEYELCMVANLDTESVEVMSAQVSLPQVNQYLSSIAVAEDQDYTDQKTWTIIPRIASSPQISTYVSTNCEHNFGHYIDGILPLKALADKIFGKD